ncbi:uncharacterized [Tachysurus ichikawai]
MKVKINTKNISVVTLEYVSLPSTNTLFPNIRIWSHSNVSHFRKTSQTRRRSEQRNDIGERRHFMLQQKVCPSQRCAGIQVSSCLMPSVPSTASASTVNSQNTA